MEDKKQIETLVKLYEEAVKLNVKDLFNKALSIGIRIGYDIAVKGFEER